MPWPSAQPCQKGGWKPSALHGGKVIIAARYAEGVRGLVGPNAGVRLSHQEANDRRGIRLAVFQRRVYPCDYRLSARALAGVALLQAGSADPLKCHPAN